MSSRPGQVYTKLSAKPIRSARTSHPSDQSSSSDPMAKMESPKFAFKANGSKDVKILFCPRKTRWIASQTTKAVKLLVFKRSSDNAPFCC